MNVFKTIFFILYSSISIINRKFININIKMKVLIACESSGVVRDAFRKLGHDAWSCDLLPADKNTDSKYHIQGDVLIHEMGIHNPKWDLIIAHIYVAQVFIG